MKISPCPFCGEAVQVRLDSFEMSPVSGQEEWERSGYEGWFVICICTAQGPTCYADGDPPTEVARTLAKQSAVDEWNARYLQAVTTASSSAE